MRYGMRSQLSKDPRHVACLTLIFIGVGGWRRATRGPCSGLGFLDPGMTTAQLAGRVARGSTGPEVSFLGRKGRVRAGQRLVTVRRSAAKRR